MYWLYFNNEIIVFMNETNSMSNDGAKRMPAAGQPHLPHIVTVGRYRVGRVLERLLVQVQGWQRLQGVGHHGVGVQRLRGGVRPRGRGHQAARP